MRPRWQKVVVLLDDSARSRKTKAWSSAVGLRSNGTSVFMACVCRTCNMQQLRRQFLRDVAPAEVAASPVDNRCMSRRGRGHRPRTRTPSRRTPADTHTGQTQAQTHNYIQMHTPSGMAGQHHPHLATVPLSQEHTAANKSMSARECEAAQRTTHGTRFFHRSHKKSRSGNHNTHKPQLPAIRLGSTAADESNHTRAERGLGVPASRKRAERAQKARRNTATRASCAWTAVLGHQQRSCGYTNSPSEGRVRESESRLERTEHQPTTASRTDD
jgi:hypothetical protein